MRRTDRLFEMMALFRDGRLWTGQKLADKLEVSIRTIYRDIDTLVASGVPIEGERGVGFMVRGRIFLPPLTLTQDEYDALRFGVNLTQKSADANLAQAADSLLQKLSAVVPDRITAPPSSMVTYHDAFVDDVRYLPEIRKAIHESRRVWIRYTDADGEFSERHIRPLQIEFWGRVWLVATWCELREDFRVFRTDRILSLNLDDPYEVEPGQSLGDYISQLDVT